MPGPSQSDAPHADRAREAVRQARLYAAELSAEKMCMRDGAGGEALDLAADQGHALRHSIAEAAAAITEALLHVAEAIDRAGIQR